MGELGTLRECDSDGKLGGEMAMWLCCGLELERGVGVGLGEGVFSLLGSFCVSGGEECCDGIVSRTRGCLCQSRLRLPRRTSGIVSWW